MAEELIELLDTAIYKEIASEAFYDAWRKKTRDEGARALIQELAKEEHKHTNLLKSIKEKRLDICAWRSKEVPNMLISDYLTGTDTLEGAGLQDTLIFAMKREQEAVEFYSRLMGMIKDETAKCVCERLVHQELRHKLKLEMFYDELFYKEN